MKKTVFVIFSFMIFVCISFKSFAQPVANFSATPLSGCLPLQVTFTDLSLGAPTAWNWDFGNSNSSTSQNNNTATYSIPGTYTVVLTVTNASGSSSHSQTINVYARPIASFTLNPDSACVGNPVTFTSTSSIGSGPITNWRWTFGDGVVIDSNLSSVNHSYTFSQAQPFPVSLVVTDIHGCNSVANSSIPIIAGPLANFTAAPLSSCNAPLTVTFTNTSTGNPSGYQWQFGDGGTSSSAAASVTHTYTTSGIFTVTLHANSSGCSSVLVRNAYIVIQNTVANFTGDTAVCVGTTAHFFDNSVPLSTGRLWAFGDGATSTVANPSHNYSNPGTYIVTLSALANGCTDTATRTIVVHPLPAVSFTGDSIFGCNSPHLVNFSDHTIGAVSWHWDFGDGDTSVNQYPSHTYTSTGYFTVILIARNSFSCTGSLGITNYIHVDPPFAYFTSFPDSGCVPLTVSFTSTSTSSQPIISYTWDFGNGTLTDTIPNATNTYTSPGLYTVKLIIVTQSGCTDSVIYTNIIRAGTPPISDFTWNPDSICFGDAISFTDQSTGGADEWFWTFGDNGSSHQQNPTYQYNDTGLFTVRLITYYNGCPDTIIYPDIIRVLPPVPFFVYAIDCANPYTIAFSDSSAGADSLVWDFGDGTMDTSNVRFPVHVYTSRGTKFVTLIAYNHTTGCEYAYFSVLYITEPIALFNQQPMSGCYPLTVFFTDTSQDANIRSWNFGDPASGVNNYSYSLTPSHLYAVPGDYSVKLTIDDLHGCIDSLKKVDIIHVVGPMPGFRVDDTTGCTPLNVLFTDTSIAHGSSIISYHWFFGDGHDTITTSASILHTYTIPGHDTITLVVTDGNGCVKSITRPGFIVPTYPLPSLSVPQYACPNQPVTFNASATATTPGSVFDWIFGDGSSFASTNPITTHTYTADSNYVVFLTVTDINGCDSTIIDTIHVLSPHANFALNTNDYFCKYTQVSFGDLSTGQIAGWHWSFGDGGSSFIQNPNYTYTTPGFYDVTLLATSVTGCRDSITIDSLVVVPGTIGQFTFTPDSGCHPLEVTFNGTSSYFGINDSSLFYTWDFGDGIVEGQQLLDTIRHTYQRDGLFHPFLIIGFTLMNGDQCLDSTTAPGPIIVASNLHVDIDSISVTLSEGEQVLLNSFVTDSVGGPIYIYSWTPAQLATCPTCPSTIIGTDEVSPYTYYVLKVTDNLGCEAFDSVLVNFISCESHVLIPNVFTPNGDEFNDTYYLQHTCPGEFHFTIYNRWGKIIYESGDPHFHWNGKTTNGDDASDGTYYYVCNMQKSQMHGFLQLIRK